jgi:hypothetical protein
VKIIISFIFSPFKIIEASNLVFIFHGTKTSHNNVIRKSSFSFSIGYDSLPNRVANADLGIPALPFAHEYVSANKNLTRIFIYEY